MKPFATHARPRSHPLGLPNPTLSIECEPCGGRGRYTIARHMQYCGEAKLPELLTDLAYLPQGAIAERLRSLSRGLRKKFQIALSRPDASLGRVLINLR